MRREIAQKQLLNRSSETMLRQTLRLEHMVMMNMIPWTKKFILNSIGKVEANIISTRRSNTKGNRYTTSSSNRGETCNSKIVLKGNVVNIQTSKQTT